MSTATMLAPSEIRALRQATYNARVVKIIEVNDDLRILRVMPDHGAPEFSPGQYCVLGLGNWERRAPDCDEKHLDEAHLRKVLKRAYLFSCPMLDDDGQLLPPELSNFLEFYIVLVRHGADHPPGLTPRLFDLGVNDRLFVGPKATGHYTLERVTPTDNVVFVATGTGEAPHNTMVAHLLHVGHTGRLVSVTCVRRKRDLGYFNTHRELQRRYENYTYRTLNTREPENLDPSRPEYVGKRYLQEYFESSDFEHEMGLKLDPAVTHIYLCGNPAMIGAPVRGATRDERYPNPTGMVEILERRGFKADEPHDPGNVHYEKYWYAGG